MTLLHFIFVIPEDDLGARKAEFGYVQRMAGFFGSWIRKKFSADFEVRSDVMVTRPRGLFRRLDTHDLIDDHVSRGRDDYHFYLTHFRPFWTDCTCEGYHAENFGMAWWQPPKNSRGNNRNAGNDDDNGAESTDMFLAEKNCTVVSHEIAHEMLRRRGVKKHAAAVHDVWVRHFYDGLEFEQYGDDHEPTTGRPAFLTIDTADLVTAR